MGTGATTALLQLISAAVTPVVMISACAALILGVNNKHTSLSQQIRDCLAHLRSTVDAPGRRAQILEQVRLFRFRFTLTWVALYALYAAVMVFTLTAFLIVLTQRKFMTFENGALYPFMAGMALMIVAAACELVEVGYSRATICVEMRDMPELERVPCLDSRSGVEDAERGRGVTQRG